MMRLWTGNPTATTQATGNNSTRLATTAFVIAEILSRFNNANLLGIPTIGSTPLLTDNSSAIANTNFVKSVFHRYSRIIESQASGTAGGSAVAGIQTRNLNTIVNNAGDVVSLTNNRFTLRSGTYRIVASSPALSVNSHRIFLWNVAASTRTLNGKPTYSSGANAVSPALLQGIFTVVGNTDFEIRHYCQTAVVTSGGLGVSAGDGTNEIYTEVEIWRID
ncbi:MAG: hypothetical protein HC781_01585 [Leptolyngbyaceae cyanobacterium CSU_1_4]|nr:hypothetical protein [Leptolyngbyaceae cyanobacterium CSU_1_4]